MLRCGRVLRATHAFIRPPHYRSVPGTGPTGAVVNRDALMNQYKEFYMTLRQSSLIDKLTIMSERSTFEACKVADQLSCIGPSCVGMPLTGHEHRATEFIETMRYIRNAGGPTTAASYLQDAEAGGARCHSGDIVALPTGIAVGCGPRTNAAAHQVLHDLFAIDDPHAPFNVLMLEQEGDAPPLGDYFGFAGNNALLAWRDEHGMLAIEQFHASNPNSGVQVVLLDPGCHFFTFYGADMSNDVIVMRGFEGSNDALAAAGLNPIPVQWSEMDKMGVSMRSCVLMIRFLRTNTGGLLERNRARGSRWQSLQIE